MLIGVPRREEEGHFAAWKGGDGQPPRGAAAPRFDVFCLKFALFPSTPRELSLPPLDRARRCDSFAPNESSVAQFLAPFWARVVNLF